MSDDSRVRSALTKWRPWSAKHVLFAIFAGLLGCSSSDKPEAAPPAEARGAIAGNTQIDTTGRYSAVVGVAFKNGGVATGVALSNRVVATAAHLIPDIVRGCQSFTYRQPAAAGQAADSDIVVQTGDANGNVFPGGPDPANVYAVDAVAGRHRVAPLNAYTCCDGNPFGCDACAVTTADPNWFHAYDVALLHLDRPLVGVKPLNFVARIGPTSAGVRAFPIDPPSWKNSAIVTLVGVGAVDLPAGSSLGFRRIGSATVVDLNALWSTTTPANNPIINLGSVALNGACDTAATTTESCEDCMIGVGNPPGGPGRLGGDSGAPIIVNDTANGGTAIPGLPAGEPFVVGFGSKGAWVANPNGTWNSAAWDKSVVTWDTKLDSGEIINTGTWLQSHLGDWDQDGIDDANDNCPLAFNPSQANCNQDAEDARGVARLGDACDPIPCAESSPAQSTFVGTTLDTGFFTEVTGRAIRDVVQVTPRGSHYFTNGAQNHVGLKEVSVGPVDTHYRFCQPDAANFVTCTGTLAVNASLVNLEPSYPTSARPWMKMRMVLKAPSFLPPFDHEPLDHPSASVERRWLYKDDYQSWATSGKITIPTGCDPVNGCPSIVYGYGTSLDGQLWTRSSTPQGTFDSPVSASAVGYFAPPDTGYHPSAGAPTSEDVHLASNYIPLRPDGATRHVTGKPLYPAPYFRFRWWWPDPLRPDGWSAPASHDTALMPLDDGHVGLLLDSGEALLADDLVGTELRTLMRGGDVRWVDAVEPTLAVGATRFDAGVLALGLSRDGTSITERVMRSEHGIGTARETGAGQCAEPPSGLIGWWPLDGAPADIAPVAAPHDGTPKGQATMGPGVVSGGALFPLLREAGGHMTVPNDDGAFDLANDFTVEAWVYPNASASAAGAERMIVSRGARRAWSVGLAADGTLRATKGNDERVIQTAIVPAAERWQHIAVTFASDGVRFYLDGQLAHLDEGAVATANITYDTPRESVVWGAVDADGGFLDGWLDEASIYQRALSAAEIGVIAKAGARGKCKAPPSTPPAGRGPSAREGYEAVWSRAENALFVLGGHASGAPLGDIWMQRVDPPGSWVEVPQSGARIEQVLSATWSHRDHRLWVLDTYESGGEPKYRLLRVEPYLGIVQVVGEWTRRADVSRRSLLVDQDGQVLLVSSSERADKHTVMRFEATPFDDSARVRAALAVRSGTLAFDPIIDGGGYTFVIAGRELGVQRVDGLSFTAAALGDDERELE